MTGACLWHGNHYIENPGAYQTLVPTDQGDGQDGFREKEIVYGDFLLLTGARLMGDTVSGCNTFSGNTDGDINAL